VPVPTLYQNGVKMGCPPSANNHLRAKRSVVDGWSPGAIRRNTDFLKSVDVSKLDGLGYALTLSVGGEIPSPVEFRAMFAAWVKRVRRAGMVRLHWVIEWQRRGAPHLHVAVYFPVDTPMFGGALLGAWLEVSKATESGLLGQCVKRIDGPLGWLQYLAKHASRGAAMYQRSAASVPLSWKGRTGRLWGRLGEWPLGPVLRFQLQGGEGDGGYYALRRLVRSWRVADSRAESVLKVRVRRVRLARGMLRCSDIHLSRVRGVSEWIGCEQMLRFLDNLASRGYQIGDYVSQGDRLAQTSRESSRNVPPAGAEVLPLAG
jgi:hypothetical protein